MAEEPGRMTEEKDRNLIETEDTSGGKSSEDLAMEQYDSGSYPTSLEGQESETEEIRENIAATREQMSETIDAIQERLSFANISEQVKAGVSEQLSDVYESAKNSLYQATTEKAGKFMKNIGQGLNNINESVPTGAKRVIPFALIGLGVGLLFMTRRNGEATTNYRGVRAGDGSDQSLLSSAQTKVSDTASRALESASEKASTAYRVVSDTTQEVYEKAGELRSKALDQYRHISYENPLAIGAAAIAIGAVVGWAIPSTSYESELMGETRDNLMAKAEDTARDTLHKAQEVGEQAVKAINEGTATGSP